MIQRTLFNDLLGDSLRSLFLRPILGTDLEAFKKNSSPAYPRRATFGYALAPFNMKSLTVSNWSLLSTRDTAGLSSISVSQMLFCNFFSAFSSIDNTCDVCTQTKPEKVNKNIVYSYRLLFNRKILLYLFYYIVIFTYINYYYHL